MKEKFYVFTDIDGTLYDINYQHKVVIPRLESMFGKNVLASMDQDELDRECIDPKCVQALDYLLASLEEDFDTHLIITSDLRSKMPPLVEKLRERGLKYPKNIDCTPKIKNCQRGREILSYLDEKPNPENIVIIDDGNYDLKENFPTEKIIHLDHGTKVDDKEYSLNKGHVDNFLISLNRAKPQSDPISSR